MREIVPRFSRRLPNIDRPATRRSFRHSLSDTAATIGCMNKHQIALSRHGVRLLTGHLRGKGESLDQACADKDAEAASSCADPLVQVAAILLRRLRTATNGTI